jgi:hypothetical protein
MRYFFFLLVFLIISCTKDSTPKKSQNLDNFYYNNYYVESWFFEDFTTNEKYDLFVNREVDSIILCFSSSKLLVARLEFTSGNKFGINSDVWEILNIDNQLYFKRDQFTYFRLVESNEESMVWEGEHSLHKQKQRITIRLKQIKESSSLIDELILRFL